MGVWFTEASSLVCLLQVSFRLDAGQGSAGEDWGLCGGFQRGIVAGLEGDCCSQHRPNPVHAP